MGKDAYYRKLLRDPDPRRRKATITQLAKAVDTDALDELLWVYEHDPEPRLRELADKAWRHIKREAALGTTPKVTTPETKPAEEPIVMLSPLSDYTVGDAVQSRKKTGTLNWRDELGVEIPGAKKTQSRMQVYQQAQQTIATDESGISDADHEKADRYVQHAIESSIQGDWKRVGKLLRAALEINPMLSSSGTVLGLLSRAYDIPPDEVVARINRENRQNEMMGIKREKVSLFSWRQTQFFLLELGFWYVVLSLLLCFTFLTQISSIKRNLAQARASYIQLTPLERNMLSAFDQSSGWDSTGEWIQTSFIYGIGLILLIFFYAAFTWFIGMYFRHASSDLYVFVRALMRGAVGVLVVSGIFWAVTQKAVNPNETLGIILTVIPLVVGLSLAAWYLGKGQENGLMKGYLQIGASTVVLGVVTWWLVLIIGFMPGFKNPLKKVMPVENMPAYATAAEAANGESTYDYPWSLLPIPPGLPLPNRPLNEYLP